MKRGFLNSSKKASEQGAPAATKASSSEQPALSPQITRASYGKVNEAEKLPPGFKVAELNIKEADPDKLAHHDPSTLLTTCIPNPPPAGDDQNDRSECALLAHVKQKIYATPGYPKPLPVHPNGLADSCRVAEAPGKGLGLFATRDLGAGDHIIVKRPLLVAPLAMGASSQDIPPGSTQEQMRQIALAHSEKTFEVLLSRMSPKNRELYMALCNSHTEDGSGPLVGRIRTNGFGINEGEVVEDDNAKGAVGRYSFVFDVLSRMNHSCSPNTHRIWDTAHFAMIIRASRPIRRGEEITTSYCNAMITHKQRQQALAPYDVRCACPTCSLPKNQLQKSDQLRTWFSNLITEMTILTEVATWRDRCTKSGVDQDSDGYLARLSKWAKALEAEGLETSPVYSVLVKALVVSYTMVKDNANIAIWKPKYHNYQQANKFQEL